MADGMQVRGEPFESTFGEPALAQGYQSGDILRGFGRPRGRSSDMPAATTFNRSGGDGMEQLVESFARAPGQGRRPAASRACRRAVSVMGGWLPACLPACLLACLMLAAGGVRAETGTGALRILMLGDSLTAGYGLA